jgi:hypothetical protein
MSEKVIIGYLNLGNPYFEIFPDGTVPLVHPFPMMFAICPEPCYLVDGSCLNESQITQLGKDAMRRFPGVFLTLEEAKANVRQDFPARCSHFSCIEIDDPGLILFGMDDLFDADDNLDLDGYDCEEDE